MVLVADSGVGSGRGQQRQAVSSVGEREKKRREEKWLGLLVLFFYVDD